MADLTITATQVIADTTKPVGFGLTSAAVTHAQAIGRDPTTGLWAPADCNLAGQATWTEFALAVTGAGSGQLVGWQKEGDVTLGAGAAPAVGTTYNVSATAGGIAPTADAASGHRIIRLGTGITGNKLRLGIVVTGATVP